MPDESVKEVLLYENEPARSAPVSELSASFFNFDRMVAEGGIAPGHRSGKKGFDEDSYVR